jgi:hypothetical protein
VAISVSCTSCGQIVYTVSGRKDCPKCGTLLPPPTEKNPTAASKPVLEDDAPAPVIAPLTLPFPPPAATPPQPPGPALPERMKANKVVAGRVCPACAVAIELGDEIWNCQTCFNSMHQACHETSGKCKNISCATYQAAAAAVIATSAAPVAPADKDMMECRSCGEKILKKANKCKFCGELQGAADRARIAREAREADLDDNLSGVEIAFGLLCSGIACIMAVIWIVQGKKKGWKLLMLSIITQVVVRALMAAAGR